jgi:prepilin-type N-terminal cleavage/methylation domain-containing protein
MYTYSNAPGSRRAFTLIELLVVIAIIAILAAILFPVFAQAKSAAKKAVVVSNVKQTGLQSAMYQNDYDDYYPLADTGCINSAACPGWGFGPPDEVPEEAMYPYSKNFGITVDPSDGVQSVAQRQLDECSSINKSFPGIYPANCSAMNQAQLEYSAGVRSNIGYNFAFFSPWIYEFEGSGLYVGSMAESASSVTQPAHTLMWGDASIWNRVGGSPTGGGNWVVQTPCWQSANGQYLQPFGPLIGHGGNGPTLFSYGSGWDPSPTSWIVYGGLWPYYNVTSTTAAAGAQNGDVVIGYADSHAKSLPISQVAAGCSAYGITAQRGTVTDPTQFIWATNQ